MLRLSPFPWRVHDRIPLPAMIAVYVVLTAVLPAGAQVLNHVNLERVNHRLAGHVIDYTNNHGYDRRINSPILGMPRDLYVYLPPGYDPARAYSLVLFFHMADVDEHFFVGPKLLSELEDLIARGEFPPTVVACPDGTYEGWNRFNAKHSLYVNGNGGRFEDHILQEVIPFLLANFSIRARAGGALRSWGRRLAGTARWAWRSSIATSSARSPPWPAPLNLRYSNCDGDYFENFDPSTFRWKMRYDRDEVIGKFYSGLVKVHARRFMSPVFGEGEAAAAADHADQPRRPDRDHQPPARPACHLRQLPRPRQLQLRRPGRVIPMGGRPERHRGDLGPRSRSDPLVALHPRQFPPGLPLARPAPAATHREWNSPSVSPSPPPCLEGAMNAKLAPGRVRLMSAIKSPNRRRGTFLIGSKPATSSWRAMSKQLIQGCIHHDRYGDLGNYGVEASDHSEAIRRHLVEIFAQIHESVVYCLKAAVTAGDLSSATDRDELAHFLYASLQGAILESKVERSSAPLKRFKKAVFSTLLRYTCVFGPVEVQAAHIRAGTYSERGALGTAFQRAP